MLLFWGKVLFQGNIGLLGRMGNDGWPAQAKGWIWAGLLKGQRPTLHYKL